MKYIYKLLGVGCWLLVVSCICSCELYNPTEPIPAYIHIDKITLAKNVTGFPNSSTGDEGSLSHKITDAWVYIDEQLIGCFELPVTFPVLYEGNHQIRIRAGIKVNGIAATRAPYPFYNDFSQSISLEKGTRVNLAPGVTYNENTHFSIMENFESVGHTMIKSIHSDTTLQVLTSPDPYVFEGNKSGIAYIEPAHKFECISVDSFLLPKGGASVFLEFNYKSNYNFIVGVIANGSASTQQFEALSFNPSSTWNKAYVNLTPTISGTYSANNYKITIGMINNTNSDSLALLLDNIKLVY